MRTQGPGRDGGDIVIGWLTKLVVVLAVLGVLLFDSVSIVVARVGASDDANTAAMAASESWRSYHNAQLAYTAAQSSVSAKNESVLTQGFTIDQDGTVHLEVRRLATTLLVHRIGALRRLATVTATGSGLSLGS